MGEVMGGRYELLDVIGEGGMGTVWRARDLRTGDEIAAKVLRQSDAGSILRFIRETGFRIHHPHCLVPLGWVGEDDRVVLAMPLVDGGSVATLVGDYGALPPRLVAELLRQLFSALDAVHAAGIVHRDLKPANLLLHATGSGRPDLRLSDFGIATELNGPRLTMANLVLGTPGYLAPEQLTGADPDPRQDLFAAGMVAREMLTGVRPRVVAGHLPAVTGEQPAGCPPALWTLVEELTSLDPAQRPASAAECLRRLDDPQLAWTPDAIGDVDVLDQVSHHRGDPSTTGETRPHLPSGRGDERGSAPDGVTAGATRRTSAPGGPPASESMPDRPPSSAPGATQPSSSDGGPTQRSEVVPPAHTEALRPTPTASHAAARTESVDAPKTRIDTAPEPGPVSRRQSAPAPSGPTAPAPARAQRSFDAELPQLGAPTARTAPPAPAQRPTSPARPTGEAARPDRPAAPLNGAIPLIIAAVIVVGLLVALVSWHPWAPSAAPGPAPTPAAVLRT